jgi:TnsA endonuclease N terminal
MSRKYAQGKFQIRNPAKYIGKGTPTYRSGWEFAFMQFCDNNPAVLQWASESINIPYRNPFTNKQTIYVPDFLIIYIDSKNQKHAELVEVKPSTETTMESARSMRDKAYVALNHAKWAAANSWCRQNGMRFRVVTENEIFHQGSKR